MPDEKEQGDPNKDTMLEPGEGDASGMLPTVGGYDDSDETSDTETETGETKETTSGGEPDTETETEDDSPDLALLREHDLDGTYKTIPAALAGAREGRKYIEEQRVANQQLRDTLQHAYENRPPVAPQTSEDMAEQFATNPESALRQMGYVSREQIAPLVNQIQTVQARLEHQAFVDTVGQYDDLKDVATHLRTRGAPPEHGSSAIWDEMDNIYRSSPSLAQGSMTDLIPLLYDTAKARLSSGPKVSKVSETKKRGASTTSGGRSARRPSGDAPDWDSMTEKEIYEWHKERGLIS